MKFKKIMAFALVACSALVLAAGCGSSKGKEYSVTVNSKNANEVVPGMSNDEDAEGAVLFPSSAAYLVFYDDRCTFKYNLTISGDEYTIVTENCTLDPDTGELLDAKEKPAASDLIATATGTVKSANDTTIVLNPAEKVVFVIDPDKQGSAVKEQALSMHLTYAPIDADDLCGEWSSDDYPEMLDFYPEATITVSGSEITNIK